MTTPIDLAAAAFRKAAVAADAARVSLDAAIADYIAAGGSESEAARRSGLSRPTVRKILGKGTR